MINALALFAIGSVVGVVGALLGIGGGVLLVPFLVLVMHVPIHQAVAASLVTILVTSSQVASYGIQHKLTNVRLALLLNLSTLTGAVLSSSFATHISGNILETIFAFLLFGIAVLMVKHPQIKPLPGGDCSPGYWGGEYKDRRTGHTISYRPENVRAGFFTLFFSGALSGMLGISGGILNVPVMNLLCRMPLRVATETSALMVGITAVGGAIVYYLTGFVHPLLVTPIVVGVLLGTALGNRLGAKVQNKWIVALFVVILIVAGLKLLF